MKFVFKLSYEDEVSPTQYSVVAPGPAEQATGLRPPHIAMGGWKLSHIVHVHIIKPIKLSV